MLWKPIINADCDPVFSFIYLELKLCLISYRSCVRNLFHILSIEENMDTYGCTNYHTVRKNIHYIFRNVYKFALKEKSVKKEIQKMW